MKIRDRLYLNLLKQFILEDRTIDAKKQIIELIDLVGEINASYTY